MRCISHAISQMALDRAYHARNLKCVFVWPLCGGIADMGGWTQYTNPGFSSARALPFKMGAAKPFNFFSKHGFFLATSETQDLNHAKGHLVVHLCGCM